MLERRSFGEIPAKPHTQLRGPAGELRYEECITRRGFDGAFTILYHQRRPHEAVPADFADLGIDLIERSALPEGESDGPQGAPLRRHYRTRELRAGGHFVGARRPLLLNADVTLSVLHPTESLRAYFVNADADELYFVHRGRGVLRCALGELEFREGDYVCVPRGFLYRIEPGPGEQFWLLTEARGAIDVPAQYRNPVGQLRMDAPYSHRDFRAPLYREPSDEGARGLVVQRAGRFHGFALPHSPLDVVGWDGALYPWAFSIHDFQPKVGRVHLPPTIHGTFTAPGVLVCSFVPRAIDFDAAAIPCPYPHSSVDVDEVIFYSRGEFGSRLGVGEGSLSHHPAGLPHGPHPGKYEGSAASSSRARAAGELQFTDELAVMFDCARPLLATGEARAVEDAGYHRSFIA